MVAARDSNPEPADYESNVDSDTLCWTMMSDAILCRFV
jgi:hypothetical protein